MKVHIENWFYCMGIQIRKKLPILQQKLSIWREFPTRHFLQFYQKSLQAKIKIEIHAKNNFSSYRRKPKCKACFNVTSGRSAVRSSIFNLLFLTHIVRHETLNFTGCIYFWFTDVSIQQQVLKISRRLNRLPTTIFSQQMYHINWFAIKNVDQILIMTNITWSFIQSVHCFREGFGGARFDCKILDY